MTFPFHFLLFLTLDNLIHSVSSTYIFQCYIFCPAFLPTLTVLLSYLLTHLTGHLNLVKNCSYDFRSTSILLLFTISGNNATNLFKPEARKVFLPQPSLSPSTSNTHLVLHILPSEQTSNQFTSLYLYCLKSSPSYQHLRITISLIDPETDVCRISSLSCHWELGPADED